MSKPTLADARWATDETNNAAPAGGQRDTGWTPNQVAVSSYFNQLALEYYKWFQFLDGLIGTNGAITLPSGEHITLQGAGDYKHGTRTLVISAVAGRAPTGWKLVQHYNSPSDGGAISSLWIPIPLDIGDRIQTIRAYVRTSGNSEYVTISLARGDDVNGTTYYTGSASSTTGGSSVWEVLTIGSLATTVATTNCYMVRVETTTTSASIALLVGHIEIDYDRP